MKQVKVAIFIGSASDEAVVSPCAEVLKHLNIPYLFTVSSAHRTPERTAELVNNLESNGCEIFICAAGMAAHLAGAVAARTLKPVIGIPVTSSSLGGIDALFATVQMPSGYPVATVALGSSGARNAAWLAAQILALHDPNVKKQLYIAREKFKDDILSASKSIEDKYN